VKLPTRQTPATRKCQRPLSNTLTIDEHEHFYFLHGKKHKNVTRNKLVEKGTRKRKIRNKLVKKMMTPSCVRNAVPDLIFIELLFNCCANTNLFYSISFHHLSLSGVC